MKDYIFGGEGDQFFSIGKYIQNKTYQKILKIFKDNGSQPLVKQASVLMVDKARYLFVKLAKKTDQDILSLAFVPNKVLKSYLGKKFVNKRDQIVADQSLDDATKRRRLTNVLVDAFLDKSLQTGIM